MALLEIDDAVAEGLENVARSKEMSVVDFLRSLIVPTSTTTETESAPLSTAELEKELDRVTVSVPPLPKDWHRSDTYRDDY